MGTNIDDMPPEKDGSDKDGEEEVLTDQPWQYYFDPA